MYKLTFTDMLNQAVGGGNHRSFELAISYAHTVIAAGRKSTFKITRIADGVVLAQSK